MPFQLATAGGALHFSNASRSVCEHCEFTGNIAPEGGDVYVGPLVKVGSILLSTRQSQGINLHPPGSADVAPDTCWPIVCRVVEGSSRTTICGVDAKHIEQLTMGTSSVGFVQSYAVSTRLPWMEDAEHCERSTECFTKEQLLMPLSQCALDNLGSSPAGSNNPFPLPNFGERGGAVSVSPPADPSPTPQAPLDRTSGNPPFPCSNLTPLSNKWPQLHVLESSFSVPFDSQPRHLPSASMFSSSP